MCDITNNSIDDGEDGCYIDYEDLHKKRYNQNTSEEPVLIKHPTYNNGLNRIIFYCPFIKYRLMIYFKVFHFSQQFPKILQHYILSQYF